VNPANPRVVGPALADLVTGFYAAYGILGALYEREKRTGTARKVEVSMFEAMTHFNLDAFQHLFSANEVMGPFSRPSVSQSYVLECADGKWIALHMSSPEKFWQGLANAMERPDIFAGPALRQPPGAHRQPGSLIEVLRPIFARSATRRVVPPAGSRTTCRIPRCTRRPKCRTMRRPSTCSCSSRPSTHGGRPSAPCASPVSFDGQRPAGSDGAAGAGRPVGRMLNAMGRHPNRPGHIHMMVSAPGHVPVTTHLFVAHSPYIESDAVFGVRPSLVVDFEPQPAGRAPDGRSLDKPYWSAHYDFRLEPQAA
jgi:hypothetical protein